jgi:hypothetical protein
MTMRVALRHRKRPPDLNARSKPLPAHGINRLDPFDRLGD